MSKIINSLADVNFSIEDAALAGYKIRLDSDGCAQVLKADGTAYHVHNFSCDCPDSWCRNGGSYQKPDGTTACKHIFWSAQVTPCPNCNGIMTLNMEAGWKVFACHSCPTMVAFQTVRLDRLTAREQEQDKVAGQGLWGAVGLL